MKLTGKDIHAAWAYAENESTARRGFQPYERQKWESMPEASKAKYELMAESLNDKINPDGLGPEGQQAWNAFQKEQALEPTWQERERLNELERLAYCGWEEF